MPKPTFNYDPVRELGQALGASADRTRSRGRDALRSTDLALRGRPLTPGERHMIQAMFGTTAGFGRARIYPGDVHNPPRGVFPGQVYRAEQYRDAVRLGVKCVAV